MLAYNADNWTELIVGLSIFVPVVLATALTVWVLRSAKNDPDEQRRRALDAERRSRPDEGG